MTDDKPQDDASPDDPTRNSGDVTPQTEPDDQDESSNPAPAEGEPSEQTDQVPATSETQADQDEDEDAPASNQNAPEADENADEANEGSADDENPPNDEESADDEDLSGDEDPAGDENSADDDALTLEDDSGEVIEARAVVEAVLFATDMPLSSTRISQIMGVGDGRSVRGHIKSLNERYDRQGASYRIEEVAGGFQMLTLPRFNPWLGKLLRSRQESRLTPAALETLAIIAYRQPVLRADVEAIRGVSVGDFLNRLRELNLVKIVGRDEQVGRPMLYGTTKRFLEVFGLASLKDLPKVEELKPPE